MASTLYQGSPSIFHYNIIKRCLGTNKMFARIFNDEYMFPYTSEFSAQSRGFLSMLPWHFGTSLLATMVVVTCH